MLQSQQSLGSSNKIKKIHSRKQLLQWLAQQAFSYDKSLHSSFNQNSLKNGVFFLLILQKVFPMQAQTIKSKMKQKPVTQYDFQKNIVLIKKIIDKYSLQANCDINQILKNKGCFDFLNFIKNLNDGLIKVQNQEKDVISTEMILSPQKKISVNSGYKTNRQGSSSKNGQKTLSQAKSSRNYSASKTQNPFYKIKSGKNLVEIGHKQLPVLNNNRSHVIPQANKMKKSGLMSEFDSLDDCNEALYQLALQQNIQTFKIILSKVKKNALQIQGQQSFQSYLNKIYNSIFSRN